MINHYFYLFFIRKTILIHGVEKMMLAQNFSEQYQRINELANFYVGMKTVYDVSLTKNKIKEIEDLENDSRLICRYEKNENVLDIIINISITALIPHLNNKQKLFTFSKISLNGELKFEDIDTILVTHKEMKYKIPTNIKINASGHNCLHETKSLRNFLSKLDKNSNCKIGKKNYSVSEFICDEENWFNQENNFRAKKLNKIIKFHILQYSKKTFQNILKTSYYIEISIQNHKSDFRLLINLLKGIGNLENIFLINFNIDLMENQYTEFYDFLDKNKRLWFKNRYLWNIKINENCDPFVHNQILDFKKLLSKKRLLFLQCFAIENMRKSKILKFRKEVCQEIIDYLI